MKRVDGHRDDARPRGGQDHAQQGADGLRRRPCAASSRSRGMPSKYPASIQMENGSENVR